MELQGFSITISNSLPLMIQFLFNHLFIFKKLNKRISSWQCFNYFSITKLGTCNTVLKLNMSILQVIH